VLLEGGFCADLVFQGSLLGVGEYVVPMLSTDGLFFDGGLLAGVQADTTLDALSSGCAWFGRSLRSGTPYVFPVLGGWIFCSWSETLPI
jgi:hypothetical protein